MVMDEDGDVGRGMVIAVINLRGGVLWLVADGGLWWWGVSGDGG